MMKLFTAFEKFKASVKGEASWGLGENYVTVITYYPPSRISRRVVGGIRTQAVNI